VGEKEGCLVCFVNPKIGCIKPNDLAFLRLTPQLALEEK
jgi:hypothetical protein